MRPRDLEPEGGEDAESDFMLSTVLVLKNDNLPDQTAAHCKSRTGKQERSLVFDPQAKGKLPGRLSQRTCHRF